MTLLGYFLYFCERSNSLGCSLSLMWNDLECLNADHGPHGQHSYNSPFWRDSYKKFKSQSSFLTRFSSWDAVTHLSFTKTILFQNTFLVN